MSHFHEFSWGGVSAGWMPGSGDVLLEKKGVSTTLQHIIIEEDGRRPTDMALWVQQTEGTLFPLIDVQAQKLALQVRFRPQLKEGAKWEDVVRNWPQIDCRKLGRNAFTIHRWFGGKGEVLEDAINGVDGCTDPRLTIVRRPHMVANDALEGHRTHVCLGLVDTTRAGADNVLGKALTDNLASPNIHWRSLQELRELRESGQLACGFTNSVIADILMCRPELFGNG
jgi:hypothetical protein